MTQGRWLRELSVPELHARFDRRIQPRVFVDARPQAQPTMVLVGGQPGAGKTRAGAVVAAELVDAQRLTRIVGDDYRQAHPQFSELLASDPLLMPEVTAQAAGEWTRMSIEHGLRNRYSLLVEGTWRNPQVPFRTAADARAHGFGVHAVAVAVSPVVSRLSTLERYYRDVDQGNQARWTPPHAHEETIASLPRSARLIGGSEVVDRVSIIDRSGALRFDAAASSDLEQRGEAFAAALQVAMDTPLTEAEAVEWLNRAAHLHQVHQQHTVDNPQAVDVWAQITGPDTQLVQSFAAHPAAHRARRITQRSFGAGPGPQPSAPTEPHMPTTKATGIQRSSEDLGR